MKSLLSIFAVILAAAEPVVKQPTKPICIEGTLKDSFRDPVDSNFQVLYVQTTNCHYYVFLRTHDEKTVSKANNLIGGTVKIKGATPDFSPTLPRPFTKEVRLAPPHKIEVLQPPPSNPFHAPCYTNLFGMATDDIAKQGTRTAKGHVLAVWDQSKILMQALQGDIVLVVAKSCTLPAVGDFIEVAGLPETTLYNLLLNRAVWRPAAAAEKLTRAARTVSADQFTANEKGESGIIKLHGQTVKIKGSVCGMPSPDTGENIMYLENSGHIIPINIDASRSALGMLAIGCGVEATGVFVVNTPVWSPNSGLPNAKLYSIVTRYPDDIKILSRPPWLTTGKMIIIVGLLAVIIVGILIWNIMLRIVSRQRGQALAREEVKCIEYDLKVQERTRLAVELHDSLAQDMGGLALEVKTALAAGSECPAEMMHHLQIADKALQSCNNELRQCLWDLRSQALDEKDMNSAIQRTLQPHIHDEEVIARCNIPRSLLPDHTAHTMLRIVRELVINAIKHGHATQIRIAGSYNNGELKFSVSDNGTGFDINTAPGILQGHFGLEGIRERIGQMGGTFNLRSLPGRGTKATISLNISEPS